jgi:polyisoprenoid-binding protein YceI
VVIFAFFHIWHSPLRSSYSDVKHLPVTKVSGSVQYDPSDPSKTTIETAIDAASVDTRVEMRDNDLRSPNFFDAAKYSC